MELRQLRHFLALMETSNFTRAAEQCCLTPQALSKSIRRLEESLGVRLFERDTRLVQPTLFGKHIQAYAQNIEQESRSLVRAIDELLGNEINSLVIGSGIVATCRTVSEAVLTTRADDPAIDITVIEGTIETLLPPLIHGKLDIAICLLTSAINDPLIAYEELCSEPYRIFARAGHPLAGRTDVALKDLLDYPWIKGADHDVIRDRVMDSFKAAGLTAPKAAIQSDSLSFAIGFAISSDTLLVLPTEIVRREVAAGLLSAIAVEDETWALPTVVMFRRNSTRSPNALRFLRHLRAVIDHTP
jgi:DNA-binding transcriptional LysR family regulator